MHLKGKKMKALGSHKDKDKGHNGKQYEQFL